MYKTLFLSIILCFLIAGCYNTNLAWRGQIDIHANKQNASTDGTISNRPTENSRERRIDAAKEYTDSFKSDSAVSAGQNASTDKRTDTQASEKANTVPAN